MPSVRCNILRQKGTSLVRLTFAISGAIRLHSCVRRNNGSIARPGLLATIRLNQYWLHFSERASASLSRIGRAAVLSGMSFSLFDTGRPYRLCFDGQFEHLVIQVLDVPSTGASPMFPPDRPPHSTAEIGEERNANGFSAGTRPSCRSLESPDVWNILAEIGIDLLASALSDRSGTGPSCQLFRLKTRLLNRLRDNSVSLAEVAAAEGLSLRTRRDSCFRQSKPRQ